MLTRSRSTRRRSRSWILTATAAAAVIVMLSGCSEPDPIFARIQGGQVVFKFCNPVEATAVLIEVAERGTVDYGTVWEISGERPAVDGDELVYGKLWPGWAQKLEPKSIDLDRAAIWVSIGRSPILDGGGFMTATFGGWELSTSNWIDSNGDVAKPCQ
jgi:hypothetical protein